MPAVSEAATVERAAALACKAANNGAAVARANALPANAAESAMPD
jgi:hypothetical protein